MPPPRLAVKSEFKNIHGGYILDDRHKADDEFPIYRRDTTYGSEPAWIFRRATDNGKFWFFGDALPNSGAEFSFTAKSNDGPSSPELASWPHDIVESVKEPLAMNKSSGGNVMYSQRWGFQATAKLFQDEKFPHTNKSVGENVMQHQGWRFQAEWIPVRCLWEGKWNLFDGIEPQDLLQGSLGDCWFMAALSCLAEFPSEVEKVFMQPGTKELDPMGKYIVQLYDHKQERMRQVTIDEFIPCRPVRWFDDEAEPLFSKPHGNEAWVLLLEKAMAKLMGSYSLLDGGNPAVALRALTGCNNTFMWKQERDSWEKHILQSGTPPSFKSDGCQLQQTSEDVFLYLADYDRSCYLMAAAIENKKGVAEQKRPDGLVEGHAYSLLQVVQIDSQRLMCLRNPWGNAQEWNLAWSDGDGIWDRYPRVKQRLKIRDGKDGLFWMSWEDFRKRFNTVYVCACQMRNGQDAKAHSEAQQTGQKSAVVSSTPRIVRGPKTTAGGQSQTTNGHAMEPQMDHLNPELLASAVDQCVQAKGRAPPPPAPGHLPSSRPHSSIPKVTQDPKAPHTPQLSNRTTLSQVHHKMMSGHYDLDEAPPPEPPRPPGWAPREHGAWSHGLPTQSQHSSVVRDGHRDDTGYPPRIGFVYQDSRAPPPPAPTDLPGGLHHSSKRDTRSESPPTPPPPPMPPVRPLPPPYILRRERKNEVEVPARLGKRNQALQTPHESLMMTSGLQQNFPVWASSGSPFSRSPTSPMVQPLWSAYAGEASFSSWHSTPLPPASPLFTPGLNGGHVRADEVESLSGRVRALVQESSSDAAGMSLHRAQQLAQEMRDIEMSCKESAEYWTETQNILESVRSELVQHEASLIREGPSAHRARDNVTPSMLQPSSARHKEARVEPVRSSGSARQGDAARAREAFRERMTKVMRQYGQPDDTWDLNGIFQEIDSQRAAAKDCVVAKGTH